MCQLLPMLSCWSGFLADLSNPGIAVDGLEEPVDVDLAPLLGEGDVLLRA